MSEPIKKAYVVEWTGPFTDEQLDQIKDKILAVFAKNT